MSLVPERLLTILALGLSLCCLSCERKRSSSLSGRSPEDKQIYDALSPVELPVPNGYAALIKLSEGFALLIPHMDDIDEGSYEIIYSRSGNFKVDGVQLEKKSGRIVDRRVSIKGHQLTLSGETAHSTWVKLDLDDRKTAIAVVPSNKPEETDVSGFRFEVNPSMDAKEFEVFLRKRGVIK